MTIGRSFSHSVLFASKSLMSEIIIEFLSAFSFFEGKYE